MILSLFSGCFTLPGLPTCSYLLCTCTHLHSLASRHQLYIILSVTCKCTTSRRCHERYIFMYYATWLSRAISTKAAKTNTNISITTNVFPDKKFSLDVSSISAAT